MTQEYICTKQVTAWPQVSAPKVLVCGVGCKPRGENCNGYCDGEAVAPALAPTEDGYAVKYADGYTSWSPKAAFEAGYVCIGHVSHLHTFAQRLIAENTLLRESIRKLKLFYMEPAFTALEDEDQRLLKAQLVAMEEYSMILGARVGRLGYIG